MKSNKELYNDFFKQIDKSENEVLSIIQAQFSEGDTFMTNKRTELDANFELYKNTLEQNGEIGDEITYSTVNALIARSISEEFRGEIVANDVRTQIIADNINGLLQQDYDNDDMLSVDLYGSFFKYIMGVFIKFDIGWNGKTKSPIFNYVDPRSWIPDPNGDYSTGKFAYSGFETLIGGFAIDTERLNYDMLSPLNQGYSSSSLQKYKDQQLEGYVNIGTGVNNPYYDIYYHYFYIVDKKGKQRKALAILGNGQSLLLKIELFEDISKDIEVEFPFSFEYFGFEVNNPLGDNVVNHTAEPQKIKALMRNLRVKKSKAELYPMYFYNDKYLDKNKLAFGFNKFIPVSTKQDGAIDLNSIITAFRPDSRADNSYIIDNDMNNQVEKATSIGANIQGSTIEGADTKATEMSLIQSNSDINISYREKIANIGKKQFVRVYLQSYLRNFEAGDKKILMLDNGIGISPVELTKKDIFLQAYNKIRIVSKTQVEIQRRKEVQAISQLVNLVMSMDNIDNYQKILMLRDYAEALGYAKNKILTRLSGGPEEELIKGENEILEGGTFFPIDATDNHLMHTILQKPFINSTNEALIHFQSHIDAWIKSGKKIETSVNGTQQAMQASMAASGNAQMSQQTPQNTPITT